jgi:hypothetical protein
MAALPVDALEHYGKGLTPLDRRVDFSFKDRVSLSLKSGRFDGGLALSPRRVSTDQFGRHRSSA